MHSVFSGNVDPSSSTVKKVVQDDSSCNQRPHCLDVLEETGGNKILNSAVVSGSVKSTEMENKILHQLHKLVPSPTGKSAKLNDDPVEESNWIHTIPKGEALIS